MLRMGRNPKDDKSDATADHTPQPPVSTYGNTNASSSNPNAAPTNASGGAPSAADNLYQPSVQTPAASRAITESESLARDIKEGTLSGFVGNGTVLTGEASFKGMLRVDGHLSGRVSSQDGTLIISTNGQVDANIEVSVAQIYGTVNGDIIASKRIEMGRVAKVNGNIQTPALVIENGALFEGSCRMVQLKEDYDKRERDAASGISGSSTGGSATTGNAASTGSTSGAGNAATGGSSSRDKTSGSASGSSSGASPATDTAGAASGGSVSS